jgi:hypothetical protein
MGNSITYLPFESIVRLECVKLVFKHTPFENVDGALYIAERLHDYVMTNTRFDRPVVVERQNPL